MTKDTDKNLKTLSQKIKLESNNSKKRKDKKKVIFTEEKNVLNKKPQYSHQI